MEGSNSARPARTLEAEMIVAAKVAIAAFVIALLVVGAVLGWALRELAGSWLGRC